MCLNMLEKSSVIFDNYALVDYFDIARFSDGFCMQDSMNNIVERWGSLEILAAVLEAAKSTERLYDLSMKDINAFGDALKRQGYKIVRVEHERNGI